MDELAAEIMQELHRNNYKIPSNAIHFTLSAGYPPKELIRNSMETVDDLGLTKSVITLKFIVKKTY